MSASSRSSSPTSSVSSGGKYVPVHKRYSGSFSPSSSRASSSRASTSSESENAISPPTQPAFIYSRDTLLNLAQSPLARLPMELRDSLRGDVPEIITNRKQRKAIEYHNQLVQNTAVSHRSRPSVRAPTERRRRNTPQVVDHVGWRGMRPIVTPITV